jgi:L-lactate dehydrogenase complex protein LldG
MTTSRDDILTKIRDLRWEGPPLPSLDQEWTRYADPQKQFAEVLKAVGGRCVPVATAADANAELRTFEPYTSGTKTVSLVAGIGETNFDLAAVTDPHDLEDIDFAVVPGQVAVAENGAVWVTDTLVPHRVLYFLPQHVALVVSASQLVHNMHEAAAKIDLAAQPFGCWISGPSKTADIEQALVIGAHGARSMTVYLVDDAASVVE